MNKKHQQTRGIADRNQVAIEQNTIVEDSLLPSSEELSKLQQIDPTIIQWIMQRAEKEQDTRLNFNTEQMRLAHKNLNITKTSLWLAYTLAITTLLLGGLFIYLGKEVAGTIFGSVGVLVIIQSFLRFGRK